MEATEVAEVVGKVAERLDADDYDDHEGITEESVAEVMSWLELEIKLAAGAATLPPALAPFSEPVTSVYVKVSGSEESCGPSLSGPASTVMASVDGRAGAPPPPAVPWPWPYPEAAAGDDEKDEEEDDEWVSQVLTDGPAEEGQCGSQ